MLQNQCAWCGHRWLRWLRSFSIHIWYVRSLTEFLGSCVATRRLRLAAPLHCWSWCRRQPYSAPGGSPLFLWESCLKIEYSINHRLSNRLPQYRCGLSLYRQWYAFYIFHTECHVSHRPLSNSSHTRMLYVTDMAAVRFRLDLTDARTVGLTLRAMHGSIRSNPVDLSDCCTASIIRLY